MEVSVLRIQFVFIVFAIYPKLLKFFTLLPIFHRNISPLLSNHSTMARTKTLKPSIIKTRAQSRSVPRTGTNVRTNNETIAPAPAGRTIDIAPAPVVNTTDPAPVDDLLFAGRPKTGALKDPPVPRDRDSIIPDNDAKHLATVSMPVSWKYFPVLRIQSVYSLFLQYTPNY